MFGIEVPILAFSHCRDVVVEVSKAGGLGVLGMARKDPHSVDQESKWIDDHAQDRPYGIDILQPQQEAPTVALSPISSAIKRADAVRVPSAKNVAIFVIIACPSRAKLSECGCCLSC